MWMWMRTGGGEDDPVTRVTSSLSGLSEELSQIKDVLSTPTQSAQIEQALDRLVGVLQGLDREK